MLAASELPGWAWALIGIAIFVVLLLFSSWLSAPARYSLRDKVVVITGGSSGIGKAIAAELLKRHAHVALVARRQAVLDEAANELKVFAKENKLRTARRITTHAADVTDEAAIRAAIANAASQHGGRIDIVIASAGISQPRRFEETPSQEFLDVYKLNVIGARNAVYAALPFMAGRNPAVSVEKEGGRIMLISSQAGQAGLYGYTAYSVSFDPTSGAVINLNWTLVFICLPIIFFSYSYLPRRAPSSLFRASLRLSPKSSTLETSRSRSASRQTPTHLSLPRRTYRSPSLPSCCQSPAPRSLLKLSQSRLQTAWRAGALVFPLVSMAGCCPL
jgi:NADP-dependent 3-hydroxy acid dehydrogenase YdfG